MSPFCVTLPGLGCIWTRPWETGCGAVITPYAEAWRAVYNVLTWDTPEGAQRFADMNGGTVKHLSEVFDQSVILSPVETQSPTEPTS